MFNQIDLLCLILSSKFLVAHCICFTATIAFCNLWNFFQFLHSSSFQFAQMANVDEKKRTKCNSLWLLLNNYFLVYPFSLTPLLSLCDFKEIAFQVEIKRNNKNLNEQQFLLISFIDWIQIEKRITLKGKKDQRII